MPLSLFKRNKIQDGKDLSMVQKNSFFSWSRLVIFVFCVWFIVICWLFASSNYINESFNYIGRIKSGDLQKENIIVVENQILLVNKTVFSSVPRNSSPINPSVSVSTKAINKKIMSDPAIVVIHYNRLHYLEYTLNSLVSLRQVKSYSLYLSQDGPLEEAKNLAKKLKFRYMEHVREGSGGGTSYLASHYKWALNELFFRRNHSHVIIVEDDMIFSPDFLDFFEASAPVLAADPTLWCASSWNDLGISNLVYDSKRLFRSDFFSGLGWMLTRNIWKELSPKFPEDQWDWWMRTDTASKNRECIVPEVSRNKNIGENGVNVNSGPFYEYLKSVAWVPPLSSRAILNFGDTSYLLHDNYEKVIQKYFDIIFPVLHDGLTRDETIFDRSKLESILSGKEVSQGGYLGCVSVPYSLSLVQTVLKYSADFVTAFESTLSSNSSNLFFSEKSAVFIATYHYRNFVSLLPIFKFYFLRSTHKGLIILRSRHHVLILADIRTSLYLPADIRVKIPKSFTHVKSNEAESCDIACARHNKLCDETLFQHLNTCSALSKYFPCERGCMGVEGEDPPNYIANNIKPEFFKMCLTTTSSMLSQCNAKHETATRLCPCV